MELKEAIQYLIIAFFACSMIGSGIYLIYKLISISTGVAILFVLFLSSMLFLVLLSFGESK